MYLGLNALYYTNKDINNLLTDGFQGGFITDIEELHVLLNFWKTFEKLKPTVLNEKISSDHFGFVFPRRSFMYDAYDRKIEQFLESALQGLMIRINKPQNHYIEPDHSKTVLNLDHLGIGFILWLFLLFIAFFSFLLEFAPTVFRCILRCIHI